MGIHERFEKFNDEHLEFERIPESERLHPCAKLCGFLKLASLLNDPACFEMSGSHDQIWLPGDDDLKEPLTDSDIIYLLRCGIFHDSYSDRFATFT